MPSSEVITLITSAAYVGEEIQAEFGLIPPAFIPIGSAYLIQHQLRYLRDRHRKFISLPTDFELSKPQLKILESEGVRIIRMNPDKSLGVSVYHSILEISLGGPLEILHGDTLVISPPLQQVDAVSVDTVTEQYLWGLVSASKGFITGVCDAVVGENLTETAQMLSGFFFFEDSRELVESIKRQDFNFVHAIHDYAQNRAISVIEKIETLDCGHLRTLYASRRQLASTRHFNSLTIDDYFVCKRSEDQRKIMAEANWLRAIPSQLQPFTARLIENSSAANINEYRTLYTSYPTMAELYLARSPRMVWQRALNSCIEFLKRAQSHSKPGETSKFNWLVVDKLHDRIKKYPLFFPSIHEQLTINGHSVGTLESIVDKLENIIFAAPELPSCVMHGDFCFSNILFDLRTDRIVLIDPRGLVGDEITIYGDLRYDIAKLGHSILGRYDQIMAEGLRACCSKTDFVLEIPSDPLRDWLEEKFLTSHVGDVSFSSLEVLAAIVSLFLSMIPLHAEDSERQKTLFANALRLYSKFFLNIKSQA
jgi:hypothetical protein